MLIVGLFFINMLALGVRIPAYVFPDEESDVITHLRVSEKDLGKYSEVLDSTLEGTWYWTTHKDSFTGYVNKNDIEGKKRLKKGALIRTNPTYSSWTLTKYEADDKVQVRSKLSVGRVSITKEIPVYFRFDKPEPVQPPPVAPKPIAQVSKPVDSPVEEPITERVETATLDTGSNTPPVAVGPAKEKIQPEPAYEETPQNMQTDEPEQEAVAMQESIEETPQPVEPARPQETYVDPLLEEAPRISPQDLVDLAAPPMDLYQEFEGYLRIVAQEDPMSGVFRYQLNTRSGRRIVYVATRYMVDESFHEYLNAWINIRGTLEETKQEQTLYIEAHNIWVAPGD